MAEEPNDDNHQWKTISPYDITTLDNHSLLITQVQLKGENYDEWARSVRNLALLMGQSRSRWMT